MSGVSSFCVFEHLASRQVIEYDYSGPKARFETLDPRRGFLILVDGQSSSSHGHPIQHLDEELEGIGATTTHYVDAAAFADLPAPAPRMSWATRYWHNLQMEVALVPYLFRHQDADGGRSVPALQVTGP